jgi:tRNA(Ile2) C34 agmatinyltransferase TiaS
MKCPVCQSRMRHLGYFLWHCEECGHRCRGDLPARGEKWLHAGSARVDHLPFVHRFAA